jgi:shikimate kinase
MKTREHISLIGMSNIGKSHWSRELAARGYKHVDCDALVEEKLAVELTAQGYKGLAEVAKWMGQPYDTQYPYTSQKYVACERGVMLEIIEQLKTKPDQPLVIDTTGSVVYVGDDIMKELQALTCVVYLEATAAHAAKLFERYASNPKPVIWGESFKPSSDESLQEIARRRGAHLLAQRVARFGRQSGAKTVVSGNAVLPSEDETLHRILLESYPHLLAFRAERYRAMAEVIIPFEKHSAPGATWDKLIQNT